MTTLDKLVAAQNQIYSKTLTDEELRNIDTLVKANITQLSRRHNRIGKRALEAVPPHNMPVEDIKLTVTNTIKDPRMLVVQFMEADPLPKIFARTITSSTAAFVSQRFFHIPIATKEDHEAFVAMLTQLEEATYTSAAL